MREQVPMVAEVQDWPALAWVASIDRETGQLALRHGPLVERLEGGILEGVWAGQFEDGRFDQTDLIFGSGIRFGRERSLFVSSGTTCDRLWWHEESSHHTIGNTLPGVLAVAGASLDANYRRYRGDLESVVFGLAGHEREFPCSRGNLHVVYWDNLEQVGSIVRRVPKSSPLREWGSYSAYWRFLVETARQLGANASSPLRRHPIAVETTLSSGYDSTAASVLAREAGATRAISLSHARSLLPRRDSGRRIAEALGLESVEVSRSEAPFRDEASFVAALGWSMDLNVSRLPVSGPPSLLFTGYHGDKIWDRTHGVVNDQLVRGDASGLGLAEYRLHRGFMNCPVPYWGAREFPRIREITLSPEMAPWTLGTDYDRPIPRRIAETAGVPRAHFGRHKSATTIDEALYWPCTSEGRAQYEQYLEARGERVPQLRGLRMMNQFDLVAGARLGNRIPRLGRLPPEADWMTHWAVSALARDRYHGASRGVPVKLQVGETPE